MERANVPLPPKDRRTHIFISGVIFHDRATNEMQTHGTFPQLNQKIEKRAKEVKRCAALQRNTPVVPVIDNVSSHIDYGKLEDVEDNRYLWMDSCVYLFLEFPIVCMFRAPASECNNVAFTHPAAF